MGKISRDCDKDVTSVTERICGLNWSKSSLIEPWLTHQKTELCWITNWQFYWSRSYVRLYLKIPSQY